MSKTHAREGIPLARILAGDRHPGVVYFLAMSHRGKPAVKIGTSTRLLSRISSVSYAAALTDVLLLVPGGGDVEDAFHREFSDYRVDGYQELFWPKGRLKDFLDWTPRVPRKMRLLDRLSKGRGRSLAAEPDPDPEIEIDPAPEVEPEPAEVTPVAVVIPIEPVTDEPCGDPLEVLKLSEIVERGLIPGITLDALRKASLRWADFPDPVDHEGPANRYDPDKVVECARRHRQTLRVVAS